MKPKYLIPTKLPNMKTSVRVGQANRSFVTNYFGLMVWRHMNGKSWVKQTDLDPDTDKNNYNQFNSHVSAILESCPDVKQYIRNDVSINVLKSFCHNTKSKWKKI